MLVKLVLISDTYCILIKRARLPPHDSFYKGGINACVHGSTNCTNGIPISFKVLPMVPLVIQLVPMVPLVKTVGSQYCRQSTVLAKLSTLESHMIKYGVLNSKLINFTTKHCFYQDDIRK